MTGISNILLLAAAVQFCDMVVVATIVGDTEPAKVFSFYPLIQTLTSQDPMAFPVINSSYTRHPFNTNKEEDTS